MIAKQTLYKLLVVAGIVLVITLLFSFRYSDNDNPYWYVNGEKHYWHHQPDVYAFTNTGHSKTAMQLDQSVVSYVYYRGDFRDKINLVYFTENSTHAERQQVIDDIRYSPDFEAEYPVVTLFPDRPYHHGKWFLVDDLLMVNFKADQVNDLWVEDFAMRHHLTLFNDPASLPGNPMAYTHLYKQDRIDLQYSSGIEKAQAVYRLDSQMVANVQPNLINAYMENPEEENIVSTRDLQPQSVGDFYVVNMNSATLKVFVSLQHEQSTQFSIYDVSGQKVYAQPLNAGQHEHLADISQLVGGFYFAVLESADGQQLASEKFSTVR